MKDVNSCQDGDGSHRWPDAAARHSCRRNGGMALAICFFLLPLAFGTRASGQSYSIDWYKVSGGGGGSIGATYQISGLIGQPDAGGAMAGGNYSLTGGFWSLIAVQTLGAPLLTITQSGNTVKVLWPYPSTGWTLQQNASLSSVNGWAASGMASNDGVNNYITVSPPTENLFFRLQHP